MSHHHDRETSVTYMGNKVHNMMFYSPKGITFFIYRFIIMLN